MTQSTKKVINKTNRKTYPHMKTVFAGSRQTVSMRLLGLGSVSNVAPKQNEFKEEGTASNIF